jgi:hypothetical protein
VVFSHGLKTCTKCQKNLALNDFYTKGKFIDSRCKFCVLLKKKAGYLSKKSTKEDVFKEIIIMPFTSGMDIDTAELVDALEAFLMEEFECEQSISA